MFLKTTEKRKTKSIEGDLEGTGNVSVGLQQSHELLFSSHLPHQLDAHDQQHPLWAEKEEKHTTHSRLQDRTFEPARWQSRGRFEICETHPEHSAAKLDGHGQRECQLEFRDVDGQAGLRREGSNGDNTRYFNIFLCLCTRLLSTLCHLANTQKCLIVKVTMKYVPTIRKGGGPWWQWEVRRWGLGWASGGKGGGFGCGLSSFITASHPRHWLQNSTRLLYLPINILVLGGSQRGAAS